MAKVGRRVKELMVEELTQALKDRPNFFVASLGSLSASETDSLRKRLRASQSSILVVKRTLGLHGLSALTREEARPLLVGSVALVLPGEDLVPIAKLLVDFARENQEKVTLRGGVVEGQLLDRNGLTGLAMLPSRPQLLAQVIGVLEAPVADLAMAVEGVLGELAWILEEAGKITTPAEPVREPETSGQDRATTQQSEQTGG